MKIDPRMLQKEPFHTLAESINGMAMALAKHTMRGRVVRVTITSDVGLAMGLLPGNVAVLHTPAGDVEIESDDDRSDDHEELLDGGNT